MSKEIVLTQEELQKEIKQAFIHGQENKAMMEAGLERDETEDYVNNRMRNLLNKTKMSKEEKLRYSKWQCKLCEDTFITDSKSRWDMVGCKCGKTAVDDEEWYSRFMGKPQLLAQSNTLEELNQNKDE